MKELLRVLSNTCGYRVMYKDKLLNDERRGTHNEDGTKLSTESRKVLILATLPEVQLLASILLNAVGIPHEIFLTLDLPVSSTKHSSDSPFSSDDNDSGANSWNNRRNGATLPIGTLDYDEEGSYYCETAKKISHN
eukprot:14188591-Ditylum_brightwellii.AAC.1